MRVEVCDRGQPYQSAITTVSVNVNRNFHQARFSQSRYTETIEENTVIGSQVAQVQAEDQDRKVRVIRMLYTIVLRKVGHRLRMIDDRLNNMVYDDSI